MIKKLKWLIFISALLFCVASMTGCRESAVIEKIIYDQNVAEVDTQNDQKVVKNSSESNIEDDNLVKKKNTDDSQRKEQEQAMAANKTKEKNDDSVARRKHNDNSKNNEKADDSDKKDDDKDDDNKGDKEDNKNDDGGDTGEEDSGNENGGDREVVLPNGDKVVLPEDVSSIVAAGDAAVIAEMLGGDGIVTGTNSSLISNALSSRAFNGDLSRAKSYWSGDGSRAMSNSDFQKLLAAKPDACLVMEDSSSFSSNQIKTLRKKGIACITIPSMATYDGTINAVKTVGMIIGNREKKTGGLNAKSMARYYEAFCDDLLYSVKEVSGGVFSGGIDFNNNYFLNGRKRARNQDGGKYAAFVSGWDSASSFSLSGDAGQTLYSETGVALAPVGYSASPLSYYMSVGGVCNTGALMGESDCGTYAAIPLNINNLNCRTSGARYFSTTDSIINASTGANEIRLGSAKFKYVVADSNATKASIESSPAWACYGKTSDASGFMDYGFLGADGRTLVRSYITDENRYEVIVNPCGICSWTTGSVESVLESAWACNRINGKGSDNWVKIVIKDFYHSFYRYNLNNEELNYILNGH